MASSESPAHTPRGNTPGHTNRAPAGKACAECRRRKSRCDREVPTCGLCQKSGRSCNYEKHNRTPLTRQHLTEVETQLAHFKSLVQRYVPQISNKHQVDFSMPIEEARIGPFPGDLPDPQQGSPTPSPDGVVTPDLRFGYDDTPTRVETRELRQPASQSSTVQEKPRPPPLRDSEGRPTNHNTFSFSLETPVTNNFEWDERSGKENGDKFVDGMASLTSGANEGGYLGVASGAALLRITDARSPQLGHSSGSLPYETCPTPSIPFALTSLGQLEPFVDAYFSLFHQSYPILHEATFRAQFMEVIPRPHGNAWQVLLFVLAAVGAMMASTQSSDVYLALFEAAKVRLSIEMIETGNMSLVQALTLTSNYLQKRNKPNSGYNYMALARRIAMGLGFHKEFPSWETNVFNKESRRRIWYCLYIFDVGGIITFSRPLDFPDKGIDVELPMNVRDSDLTMGTKQIPLPVNETTIYTHLRAQATFHMATNQIYSKIISSPFPSASELIELDDRVIGKWLASLPPFFQEHVVQHSKFRLCHSILRWRYRNFRILMYRPFLVGRLMARPERGAPSQQEDSEARTEVAINRCLGAARESVDLISAFWASEHKSMMACWYGLYFLFQAILIPVICLRNDPQSSRAMEWRDQILQAIPVLESMAHLNPSSTRCLGVIHSLCGGYLDPSMSEWGLPTEESPQTQLTSLYPLMWPTLEMAQMEGMDTILQESTIMDFINQLPTIE